jgi:hypothetical protein
MKWVLDSEKNYFNIDCLFRDHPEWRDNRDDKDYNVFLSKLKTPCCNQPVTIVFPSTWDRKPYFRHIRILHCPYAKDTEYLSDTHWEIVDYMEEILQFKKKLTQIGKFRKINIKQKLQLRFGREKFLREVIMRWNSIEKRTDIVYNGFAIEIQCSPITMQEVKLREKIYAKFGLTTLWVLGYSGSVIPRVHLSQPNDLKLKKRIEMKINQIKYKKYFKNIKFKDVETDPDFIKENNQSTKILEEADSLMFKGLTIEKWRMDLLEHCNVIGIYYRKCLHNNFNVFRWYFNIPIISKYPYRKGFLLVLNTEAVEQINM